jgi:Tol biopolymer transport system component
MVGQTLGHYRIVQKIASGGMGDVFLADDTRLDRQVALKMLPVEFARDADRRARLTREARAVAALNHPNIVTVYAVERVDEIDFITMELVHGGTLAELIPRSGFPLDRFFEIAIPLVDAVSAAHQAGIMHRDLKPGNVMVTDDGRVKVLDFGLAKARSGWSDVDGAVTATASGTQDGHFVGTPAYMSPEQAEGKAVDARSDIFALGVLLYELLTGRRPFGGDTTASLVSSIIKDAAAPITEIREGIPRDVARLVHRCLAKNPIDRYQTAIDLRHDLEDARKELQSAGSGRRAVGDPATLAARSNWARRALPVGALIVLALLAWNFDAFRRLRGVTVPPGETGPQRTLQITTSLEVESYPTWSPDGQRLAFQAHESGLLLVGNHDIWVAQASGGDPVNLTKGSVANDRRPSWSPDGRDIAFYSDRDGEWGVFIVSAIGGTARRVLALGRQVGLSMSAPQWSSDGRTLFVAWREENRNVIVQVTLASLQTTKVTLPTHDSPQCWDLTIRPDGGRFAYIEAGGGNPEVGRLWTVAASGEQPVALTDGRTKVWSPTWTSDGRTVFYVSNRSGSMDLWQQRVDESGHALGDAQPVTAGLGITSAAFSPDGARLAFSRAGRVSNVWRAPIFADRPSTWADATRVTSEHAYIEFVDVSPTGTELAVSSDRRGNQDLWVLPATGGEMTQLTNDPTPDWSPRWSPDGKEIAFYAYRSGNRDIWVMPARGGAARQLTFEPRYDWFPAWSPDGSEIAFRVLDGKGAMTWIVPAKGGPSRLAAMGNGSDWSPDGTWLAFASPGTILRVPLDGSPPQRIPVQHSVSEMRISRDGQHVYYSVIEGPPEDHDLWRLSLATRQTSRLTRLAGPRGRLGYTFAADDRYVYFTWYEDDGDIWVMDAASRGGR